jgi:hypothetical protein
MGADVVMDVLLSLRLWGGIDVDVDNGQVKVDCKELLLWLKFLNNRVIDQEACGFEEEVGRSTCSRTREEWARLNFARGTESEAKRNTRQNLKRICEEFEEASAPATRRSR